MAYLRLVLLVRACTVCGQSGFEYSDMTPTWKNLYSGDEDCR